MEPLTKLCPHCGVTKPLRDFYESQPNKCMACKRAQSNAYKRRTGHNKTYWHTVTKLQKCNRSPA